jgi:hypothetical protein
LEQLKPRFSLRGNTQQDDFWPKASNYLKHFISIAVIAKYAEVFLTFQPARPFLRTFAAKDYPLAGKWCRPWLERFSHKLY